MKLLLFILASLSFVSSSLGMQWIKSIFYSRASQEKEAVKKALNLNMDGPHAASVGRDAINTELFLNHLKTFIEEIHKLNLQKNEKSSGAVIQTQQYCLILTFREKQKYMFFARNLPKSDNTVCDQVNYELHKDKSELLVHAQLLKEKINPQALHSFSLFLDRIAINKKIEEIQTDREMTVEQKVKALERALDELKDAEKSKLTKASNY